VDLNLVVGRPTSVERGGYEQELFEGHAELAKTAHLVLAGLPPNIRSAQTRVFRKEGEYGTVGYGGKSFLQQTNIRRRG
jgi:hypothetical protein